MADLSAGPLPDVPDNEAARRRRRRRRALAGLAVLIVVGAATWAGTALSSSHSVACGGSGSGLSLTNGECIGVTDGSGSYYFSDSLAPVEKDIAKENAWAVSTGSPVVTVAVLEPITVTDTSELTAAGIRNEIEGAYTAQYRANHTLAVGDRSPLIRLVLANEGSHEDQWPQVVRQLERMASDPQPLVAVTGLGLSTEQTLDGAQDLSRHGIATVAAIDTADQLNYPAIPGFIRVATSNQQYVGALRAYLNRLPGLASAIMVFDSNSDSPTSTDLFTKSLRGDLQSTFAGLLKFAPQSFVGLTGGSAASPDLFANITTNICAVSPSVVLYAGRAADINGFLGSLEQRVCAQTPIIVAAAGSNLGDLATQANALRQAHITVIYTTLADSTDWLANAPGTPPHFTDFNKAFLSLGFPESDLNDGGAIAVHDAVLTAARAIRLAAQSTPTPHAADVFSQVLNLNNEFVVPGAAGDLSFSYHGTNGSASSDPTGKPLPVITVPSASTPVPARDIYVTTQ
jgi:hypothetical protein